MATQDLQELGEVPPDAVVVHEPHGFVHLLECNADDLMVVNAARVSFRKRSEWEFVVQGKDGADETFVEVDAVRRWHERSAAWAEQRAAGDLDGPKIVGPKLNEFDEKVLRFLLKNRHGTPFEHTFFQFHVRAPIFVFREWHRHRIGISINEESARYVPLQSHFYIPDGEHVRVQVGRPGRYTYESASKDVAEDTQGALRESYRKSYETYELLMERGVAKEIARACLPVGIYSQMIWSCNARSLMNFLSLRNAPNALREIRDYAQAMEGLFAKVMPVTHSAFVENGRVSP